MKKLTTNNLGFPRIGHQRELKRATESYWKGDIDLPALRRTAAEIRKENWALQAEAGIDLIPSNDFSFYDQVLDTAAMVGAVPGRFGWRGGDVDLDLYFRMARGVQEKEAGESGPAAQAMEMTKWFDTNYHYIVPELRPGQGFKRSTNKPVDEFREAKTLGIKTKPVLVGPVSFLLLGKSRDAGFSPLSLLGGLLPVYIEVLKDLASAGAEWVQMDEPVMVTDLGPGELEAFKTAYAAFARGVPGLKIMLTFYFGYLGGNLGTALGLPVAGFHFDLLRGERDIPAILGSFPKDAHISLGLVNGRGIWVNDLSRSSDIIGKFVSALGEERVMIAPSCSLLHVPISLRNETALPADVRSMLAFAEEKLDEVVTLSSVTDGKGFEDALGKNEALLREWSENPLINDPAVKRVVAEYPAGSGGRSPFPVRQKKQREAFGLPLFPTTTIGSFPQTSEVRSRRLEFRRGEMTADEYDEYIRARIREVITLQEELGLDVLVHGEFERNDMVEFFGEMLNGFAVTLGGWVQSYGSRYVKPPIIYGDVSRPSPMTVEVIKYAASLTDKPVKGMLTGPVTILQWSFRREDIPRSGVARQIAFALREEVRDLERAGIRIIQIDEPALREGLPIRKEDWDEYLSWAVEVFHIASGAEKDETQIHTHMCYSEFNDIIESISRLDADVISIETSRSRMELLDAFRDFEYPNEIGPGVYDIHSPLIPEVGQIEDFITKASEYIPKENLWVNPDCGLKTRSEPETKAALGNMVKAARSLRQRFTK
ncbi:MAG TPA: 5-methyltetrahydropteroyltriglutamate--homocysteine S-methyltransferase [Thermodesulfobacteriota bacterium]|nr:5-methyltetrahydropteroyltriglutamate--homocysteine S-methyltransferase [Thermodesulfobacteriota bacterium]